MPSASLQHSSYRDRSSLGSKAAGLVLALLLTLAIMIAMIELGVVPPLTKLQRALTTFDVPPPPPPLATHSVSVEKTKRRNGGSAAPKRAPQEAPAIAPPTPPVKLLALSEEDFAASDIGKMAAQPDNNASGAGAGKGNGTVYGPGEGPGGEQLYNVAWYREPTHAELAYYLPHNAPETGFGEVACRMIEHYHVDNCREIGETPGSGFGRTLRLAAWQFLVQPPRVGDKPMIGTWVRIRVDFTATTVR